MAILDLISRVHLPSFVNKLPKYLKHSTFSSSWLLIITLWRLFPSYVLFKCLLFSKYLIVIFFYTWKILCVYSGIKGFIHTRKPKQHSNIITVIWINTRVSMKRENVVSYKGKYRKYFLGKFNIISEFVIRDTGVCGKGEVNTGFWWVNLRERATRKTQK